MPEELPDFFSPRTGCSSSCLLASSSAWCGAFPLTAGARTWATVQRPGRPAPADALLLCVAAAGALLFLWLVLWLALSLLAALPGAAGPPWPPESPRGSRPPRAEARRGAARRRPRRDLVRRHRGGHHGGGARHRERGSGSTGSISP